MSATTTSDRAEVRFSSGADNCHAWLYTPDSLSEAEPVPVIVMAHGLGGVKELRLDAYAERFRDAGYACLVFDYRFFGDSGGHPRELLDVERQLEDWRAAVAYARSRPEIDASRVVLWGTSFGGGHVLATAAKDPQIGAVVAQCPFTDGRASSGALSLATRAKLGVFGLRDLVAKYRGSPPVRVPSVSEPGEVGLMNAPDAMDGTEALIDASDVDRPNDRVPARIAFQILRYVPGRRAADVRCPLLVALCENDTVAPADVAAEYAQRAPRGEIVRYDIGHFDIYLGDAFERAVRDQIEFLEAHVPPRPE